MSAALPPLAVQNPSPASTSRMNFWELGGVFSNGRLNLDPPFIDTLPGPALPGRHVITMTATDSDGNNVSTAIDVMVAAGPPAPTVGLRSNSGCVATIDVRQDLYVGLADAAYSLDGGGT